MEEEAKACVPENACYPENVGALGMAKDEAIAECLQKRKSTFVRDSSRVVAELSYERKELCDNIRNLTNAIIANPEEVSFEHKALWREQHDAMLAYKNALDKRIENLIKDSKNDFAIDAEPEKA